MWVADSSSVMLLHSPVAMVTVLNVESFTNTIVEPCPRQFVLLPLDRIRITYPMKPFNAYPPFVIPVSIIVFLVFQAGLLPLRSLFLKLFLRKRTLPTRLLTLKRTSQNRVAPSSLVGPDEEPALTVRLGPTRSTSCGLATFIPMGLAHLRLTCLCTLRIG
jgi:hypothetical protein